MGSNDCGFLVLNNMCFEIFGKSGALNREKTESRQWNFGV